VYLNTAAMCAVLWQEWTDAASREVARPYLQQLIALDPTSCHEQDEEEGSDCASHHSGHARARLGEGISCSR